VHGSHREQRGRVGCTQRPFIVRTGQRRAQTGREASWAAIASGAIRNLSGCSPYELFYSSTLPELIEVRVWHELVAALDKDEHIAQICSIVTGEQILSGPLPPSCFLRARPLR